MDTIACSFGVPITCWVPLYKEKAQQFVYKVQTMIVHILHTSSESILQSGIERIIVSLLIHN